MRKTILQVYILRCDTPDQYVFQWQERNFDLFFCENIPCVRSGFESVMGRPPSQKELIFDTAQNLLKMLSDLPETVENAFVAATDETTKKLAAAAIESPVDDIPLQATPFCYTHLQWGNHRCPGKWFLQRWNATIPQ